MEEFVKGDIVVIPFPFSDLSQSKRRPACVITVLDGDDLILCQITSQNIKDRYSIPLLGANFSQGGLKINSNARPNRLFTADKTIILYRVGRLTPAKLTEIKDRIIKIVSE